MAMGKRRKRRQKSLFVDATAVSRSPGHPFYERLNEVLDRHGFDEMAEDACRSFYAERMGRPSLSPAVYFRLLLIGYFEGIDSERGIAWRVSDSLSLREFLGFGMAESPPDHSTISRTRRLIDVETHDLAFLKVLKIITNEGLLKGRTLGVDATTLEANAALRSILRRDTGEAYQDFLCSLAKASGIETPTREDLARLDKKRKKKGSNEEWYSPHDPDARITKMKDGRTHLAHKAEHAVDLETEAVVAVTVQDAVGGDTESIERTMERAASALEEVLDDPEAGEKLPDGCMSEMVTDKGYHSNDVLTTCRDLGIRTYISEPDRGRRRWQGKTAARDAVYANRRRIRGERGKRLLRRRGEVLERPMAHVYDTGGMRRTHLRGHDNILKRLLIQYSGFNLGLVMRRLLGTGKPRGLQGRSGPLLLLLGLWRTLLRAIWTPKGPFKGSGPIQELA